jgi:hypothetical protein
MDNKKIYHQRLKTLEERFWEKVNKRSPDECWEWVATKRNGYGRMYTSGRLIGAHRVSWRINFGEFPPADVKVLHKCDNPSCVNPRHLFLGTQQDNVDDMIEKGRHRYPIGENVHTNKLTEDEVREIRKLSSTLSQSSISEKFGVSKGAIKHILRGRSWSWLR